MTITIYHHDTPEGQPGKIEVVEKLSFEELQKLVGGYVQVVPVRTPKGMADICSNEDGLQMRLPRNTNATKLYDAQILISRQVGAVGNWVELSGKDRLR